LAEGFGANIEVGDFYKAAKAEEQLRKLSLS